MSALDFAMNNLFKIGQSKNMINSNPFARNPTIIVYLIRFAPEIKKSIRLDQSLGKNLHDVGGDKKLVHVLLYDIFVRYFASYFEMISQ